VDIPVRGEGNREEEPVSVEAREWLFFEKEGRADELE
jgi:hypothetical protein